MDDSPRYWLTLAPIREGGFDPKLATLKVPLRPINLLHQSDHFVLQDPKTKTIVGTLATDQIQEVQVSPCPVLGQMMPALIKGGLFAVAALVIMVIGVAKRVGMDKFLEDPDGRMPMVMLMLVGMAVGIALLFKILPAWLKARKNLLAFEFKLANDKSVMLGATESQASDLKEFLSEHGVKVT